MSIIEPVPKGGQLFHFNLTDNRRKIAVDGSRLKDRVADNLAKFDITESERILFGRNFGIATDIQTAPNGNLFVGSTSSGVVYEISRAPKRKSNTAGNPKSAAPDAVFVMLDPAAIKRDTAFNAATVSDQLARQVDRPAPKRSGEVDAAENRLELPSPSAASAKKAITTMFASLDDSDLVTNRHGGELAPERVSEDLLNQLASGYHSDDRANGASAPSAATYR